MSAPSTSSLSVELLSRVIDVKYGCFTFTFTFTGNCNRGFAWSWLATLHQILLQGITSFLSSYNYMYLSLGQFHLLYPLKKFYPSGKKKREKCWHFSPLETGRSFLLIDQRYQYPSLSPGISSALKIKFPCLSLILSLQTVCSPLKTSNLYWIFDSMKLLIIFG